ncbi:MarR family transcriptional regulator [Ancylobacter sp. 6x-1]|uniref:MarR family transcriptional regulator n=1 Tax=Ancylobacter crimeensis TaxID=2579147 RepID=A0ABT0DBE8_9HYPH|nr:MarR family transcriptional regulator [Ancylobacter crimeensis]MCK0197087.1 MarR family transcriptional regulator [Ancylobacter crimeensis]
MAAFGQPAASVRAAVAGEPGAFPARAEAVRRTAEPGFVLEEQPDFLVRAVAQRLAAIFAEHVGEGLTQPQFSTLAKLREVGSCSQNRLGRMIHLDGATIKGIVDRLIARGLVLASEDRADRRLRTVALTEAGRRVVESAIELSGERAGEMLEPLSRPERGELIRLLKKLC